MIVGVPWLDLLTMALFVWQGWNTIDFIILSTDSNIRGIICVHGKNYILAFKRSIMVRVNRTLVIFEVHLIRLSTFS